VIVVLGNRNAIQSLDNGETFNPLPKGKRATTVEIPDDMSLVDALRAIADLWPKHSHQGKPPAWVASDSPASRPWSRRTSGASRSATSRSTAPTTRPATSVARSRTSS
jgi:hypothetical protein